MAAVQESPFRLTTLEQFREFPANTEYFILETNIRKVEGCGLALSGTAFDVLLPPALLDAIDPVPFGNHAIQEEQGASPKVSHPFRRRVGSMSVPGRGRRKKALHQRNGWNRAGKECANQSKAQPHREKACAGAIRRCRYAPL